VKVKVKEEMSCSAEIKMDKHIALVYEDMETRGLEDFCKNFVYVGEGYQVALEECYNDFGPLKATLRRIIEAMGRNRCEVEGKQRKKINVDGPRLSRKRRCSESLNEEEEEDDIDIDIEGDIEAEDGDLITRTSEPPQFASALLEYYQLPNYIFI
jgi:hypothetical protein